MKVKTLMALAVGAALALPFSTMAEDKPGNTPEGRAAATFKSLDSDNDGHLSNQEMKATSTRGSSRASTRTATACLPSMNTW